MTEINSEVTVQSHVGIQAELEARVGVEAPQVVVSRSTIGKGPKGDQGDPGTPGAPGSNGTNGTDGTQIVVVANADWPPASPIADVLYLRGSL